MTTGRINQVSIDQFLSCFQGGNWSCKGVSPLFPGQWNIAPELQMDLTQWTQSWNHIQFCGRSLAKTNARFHNRPCAARVITPQSSVVASTIVGLAYSYKPHHHSIEFQSKARLSVLFLPRLAPSGCHLAGRNQFEIGREKCPVEEVRFQILKKISNPPPPT